MIWVINLILILGILWLMSLFAFSEETTDTIGNILLWVIITTIAIGSILK